MATKNETVITIPAIEVKEMELNLVGTSPLIMHAWADKAKREMLEKQMGVAKTRKHSDKNPVEDFINSMYWLTEKPTEYTEEAFDEAIKNGAKFGFPVVAFKAAAVNGAYRAGIIKNKVTANGAFHIQGEMAEIKTPNPPIMREDMVRIGMGTADIRYRGEFTNWSTTLHIRYNEGAITLEQIANIFNFGGFSCGVGEWRVEKGGSYGTFQVA